MNLKYIRILAGLAVLACVHSAMAGGKNDPGLAAYQRFQIGPPTNPKPAAEKPKPKPAEPDLKAQETASAIKAQEEANFLRRLAVCDRLKQLALELGDINLEEEALRLEQKATDVFKERTKNLSTAKPTKPGKSEGDK